MEETIFPPSPSWFLPNILATRRDGSVTYGSKNNIVILKLQSEKKPDMLIIRNAHSLRITAVAFSPLNCVESIENSVVSCSEDGYVKLWKIDTLAATIGHKGHWEQSGEIGKVISLDWSTANPHYIVSAAENNTLVLWDTLSNTTIRFSFHILGATVVRCCPYNERVVAVGGKTGQIYIISLTGKGDILYKFRGHDNKINALSWCPIPYNVFKTQDIYEEFLLASACQNKEIFIWRAGSDGKCETKFSVPTSALYPRDGPPHGKIANSFSFVALCWLEPYKIYLSSNFGELIYFDIKSYTSNKMTNGAKSEGQKSSKNLLNFGKLAHHFYTKGLFAIAGSPLIGEIEIYKDIHVKSELKFSMEANGIKVTKKIENESCRDWNVILPEESSVLWIAGQDRKLIACELKSSKMEMVLNFNTVNGIVYCAEVSPHDPNKLAIGCGDGMIRLWNLTEPCGDIQVYWQKIKDRVMSLDWHPTKDGLLAYGTSEGRVGLIDTKSNKLPSVFKPSHPLPIYNLSWGPQFPSEDKNDSTSHSEFDLYATGDNTLSLYNPSKLNADPLNLSKIISFPCKKQTDVCWKPDFSLMAVGNEDGSICLVEPTQFKIVHVVLAHKKLIHSIAWHPSSTSIDSGLSPYHGYFTSGSTDNSNEIRVFNCKKEENEVKVEQVASLKGHHGQIQSVSWCPHISGRLVSSSTDNSVQIWDVISQTPLINFTPEGKPMFSMWSPINPDFILTGCKNDYLCVWKISTQTKVFPTPTAKNKKPKNEKNILMGVSKEETNGEVENSKEVGKNSKENGILSVAKSKTTTKTSKEPKMFTKVWKGDSNDELKTCYSLLKSEAGDIERNYSLPFFCSDEENLNFIDTEEESLKKSNDCTEVFELALWKGNIKDVLEEKIKSGKLNDFLVSLAPTVSPRFWQEACLSYSKTLSEKKYYRKAASYLIVCNKLYEAIRLLLDANLYLEALFIAKSRLPKSDPMFEKIVRRYGEWLCKNGSFLKACQCFIYLEDYSEVARICGKTSQPEYLSLAALAAKKCKAVDLQILEATNALFKCFETNNFELARQICEDHKDFKHLGLIFFVYDTIHQLDGGELKLKTDILSHIKESFETESVIFPSTLPELFQKHAVYRNRRQVFSIVAQELCFAACSKTLEEAVEHVIKALSTSYRYTQNSANEVHPSYKLCHWLSPEGFLSSKSIFMLKDSELSCKIRSLRAFLCAAIVRHLNDENESSDVMKYLDVIKELEDGLLDADSCKYFKNLIEVKVCETELLENKSKVKKTSENVKRSENKEISKNVTTNGDGDSMGSDKINGHEELEKEIETESHVYERNADEENGSTEQDFEKNLNDDRGVENIEGNAEGDTESVRKSLELLNRLKTEIEVFEKERISSPHPIPVYAMLKKLCGGFRENESANFLHQILEEKFRQMN